MPWMSSDDVRVHFEVVGRGFPVVMVPPGGFDGSFWQRAGYVGKLADGLTCVPVDARGLGRSARSPDGGGYRIGELARDVVAVADDMGFGRFALWGASFGGAVAMVLPAERSDRVAALVLSPLFDYAGLPETWAEPARLVREAGDVARVIRQICDA